MALTVGQLVATIDADPSGMLRALDASELRMRGFTRDAEGRLHRLDGSLVETAVAAREMGAEVARSADRARLATVGLQRDASGTLRDVRGRYVSAGDAAERFGHQMLGTAHTAEHSLHTIGTAAEHHLGDRGVAGRSRLAHSALRGLSAGFGALASSAGPALATVGKLPAVLGVGVPLAAALASTLADVAPAASVAATGIVAVISASVALKVGMSGVGDAVKAAFDPKAKPDQLKKALDGLAPSARSFVLALRAIKPEFDGLKLSVQDRLFRGLDSVMTNTAAATLPILRNALTNTAGALNLTGQRVLNTAIGLSRSGALGTALSYASGALYNLSGVPGIVVQSLVQLAAAAGPALGRLTAAAGKAAEGISERLTRAFASGGLTRAIDGAVGILKQLGDVARNIGTVIGGVFKAAQANGGNLLGTLGAVTAALAAAVNTPAVQQGLSAMFDLFGTLSKLLGSSLGPIISQVAAAFGQIAPVITSVLNSLGDATPVVALLLTRANPLLGILALLAPVMGDLVGPIGQIIRGLTPLIDAVGVFAGQLGKALVPIVKGLAPVLAAGAAATGALLDALAPLLPIVGDLIGALLPILTPVLKALGTIFAKLAGPVKDIATALGKALAPVIEGLSDVVDDLVAQYLASFMDILGDLLPLVPQLTPVLVQLGQSVGQILAAVAPLLPQLAAMSIMFATQLLPAVLPLLPPLLQLTTLLLELATGVIVKVVVPALQGLIDFMKGLQRGFQPAIDAVKWLTTGIASLFEWLADHLVGHSVIPDMVRSIVSWFAGLPGKAVAALGNIASRLAGVMVDATNRMIGAVIAGLRAIVSWMRDLPGRAKDALGDLGSYLYRSGQALLRGFADGIKSMASHVKNAASSVLSGVSGLFPHSPAKEGPFSGRGYPLYSGQAIGEALGDGMLARAEHVKRAAATMMGAAAGALGVQPGGGLGSLAMAGGVGGGFAGGGGTVRHEYVLRVEGSDPLARAIREMVRAKGGGGSNSVQRAFG
jgi:phage-related protein